MNNPVQRSREAEIVRPAPPGFPDRAEMELLLKIGLFSSDDAIALRRLWRILKGQTDDYLDMVLGMVAAHPTLVEALAALRKEEPALSSLDDAETTRGRCRRWLFETCFFPQEPPWIKELYVEQSPPASLAQPAALPQGFRHAIALAYPLVATVHPFLVASGRDQPEIERMQSAFLKAILLQVALLSKLYVKDGLW